MFELLKFKNQKLEKEELTKIIKRYLSANKKEEIKKKIDKNFNTDKILYHLFQGFHNPI